MGRGMSRYDKWRSSMGTNTSLGTRCMARSTDFDLILRFRLENSSSRSTLSFFSNSRCDIETNITSHNVGDNNGSRHAFDSHSRFSSGLP